MERSMSNHDSTKYVYGEQVEIVLRGKVFIHDAQGLQVQLDDWYFSVPADALVTRLVPADGTPQPGELWRTDDSADSFFVIDGGRMVDRTGTARPWTDVIETSGPLSRIYQPGPSVDHIPAAAQATS